MFYGQSTRPCGFVTYYAKLRSGLVVVLLAAGIGVGGTLCAFLTTAATAAEQARVTMLHLDDTIQDIDAGVAAGRLYEDALARRVLGEGGVLDKLEDEQVQIRDVTRAGRVTADEVGQASIEQRHYWEVELPMLTSDVAETLRQSRVTIAAARPVLMQARSTLAGFEPLQVASAQAVKDVDARVSSPQVTAMLDAGAAAAPQLSQAAANVNASTADARAELHGFLHPKWPGKLGRKLKHLF